MSIRRSLPSALTTCSLALATFTASNVALAEKPLSPPGFGGEPVGPGLYRFAGTDPSLPTGDLAPLQAIISNARYVGLGESFHTSGGFYEAKHRIFRYLVNEMGFRVLAMETPWTSAERVRTYVETCGETPQAALNGVFSVFRSEETAALIQWMCEWNVANPNDRVHFYGFDVQRQAKPSGDAILAYLAQIGVPASDPMITGVQACDGVVEAFYPARPFPADRYETCQSALADVEAYFDAEENVIRHATSADALEDARIHLFAEREVQAFQRAARIDVFQAVGIRDRAMAHMVEAIHDLRHPGARTAIWAHNGHIVENSTDALDYVSMGNYLAASLGDHYRNIGLVAHVTNVNWATIGLCGPVDFGVEDPLEDDLHAVGQGDLIVDLNPRGSFASFVDPDLQISAGGFYPSSVPSNYDALIYLEESRKMASLAWPVCQ